MTKTIPEKVTEMLSLSPRDCYFEMRRLWSIGHFKTITAVGKALSQKRAPLGSWYEAKKILDTMTEPNIAMNDYDKKHLDTYLPDILGYHCHYVKNRTKKGIKSWIALVNGDLGCVYVKDFSQVTAEDVVDIFNS